MATNTKRPTKRSPAKPDVARGRGRPSESKEDWEAAGYRLPPGLRDAIRAAFYRAAGGGALNFVVNVEMTKPPTSMNEFVAAILDAAARSI